MAGNGNEGRVVAVLGPVVEVEFSEGHIPSLYNQLTVVSGAGEVPGAEQPSDGPPGLGLEVMHHLGENFQRLDDARAGPVEVLIAVGDENPPIAHRANALPSAVLLQQV